MVAVARRREWRRVLAAASVPCLAVLAWYGRNLWLFGSFVGSTWLGMNFADITTLKIPREERAALVSRGILSPFALIPTFRALDDYRPYLPERSPTGIAVLDQDRKPSGAPNFNHRAYIDVARRYRRDALIVLRTRPRAYLDGLTEAWLRYFVPASDHDWLAANRFKIREWDRLYAVALCGRFRDDVWPKSPEVIDPDATWSLGRKLLNTGLFLLAACPLLFVYGLVAARRAWARGEGPAFAATLAFLCFTIAYVTVAGNALEVGENFRNRFTLAPFYVTLLGLFLAARWRRAPGRFR
jgi:hypothetical protein